jgi:enoyl-CoA hydratase/carnithine racemase
MTTEIIKTEIKDYVATVTIDRPPVNAMNRQMFDEIQTAFDALNNRADVRAAVFTGAGKCFCAGADMKARSANLEGQQTPRQGAMWAHSRAAREAFNSILECSVPIVCAINGPALGGGLALVASCDILIASENAVLGLPEIDVGLLGGGRHCQRLFGVYKARKMMYTGERVGAAELYRLGIVEKVVSPEKLMDEAHALARNIADKSPLAIRLAKHAMNTIEFMDLRNGYRFEQNMTHELTGSEDAKEAARAFVEKRKPVFKGQ